MNEFTRKARLHKLRLIVWLRWLAFEFEPAGSMEFRTVAQKYAIAKKDLESALLKERERRMNRRVI